MSFEQMAAIKLTKSEIQNLKVFIESIFGDVFIQSRVSELVYKRKVIFDVLHSIGISISDIGRISHRHHTTILYIVGNDFICKDLEFIKNEFNFFSKSLTEFLKTNKIPFIHNNSNENRESY